MKTKIDFTRVNNDINGNPRYVCHFLNFINEGDRAKADASRTDRFAISIMYDIAVQKAKAIGGRKYHNKQYGGGIVFQSYNIADTERHILEAKKINVKFKKEWTDKEFNKMEKKIYSFLAYSDFKFMAKHGEEAKPISFLNYEQIENLLGLAYTSSSAYAGLWVCNGGYLMADSTHHFTGFAINQEGKFIAIADDENEKELYIEM